MKIIQGKPKKYLTTALIGFVALGAVLLIPLTACSSNAGPDPVRSSAESSESRVSAESGGGEQSSEHQGGSESGEHSSGVESGEGSTGAQSDTGSEESATQFTLTDTFDDVRAGARLILSYDAATNAFTGTVENTTAAPLQQVRVEVHLSNGTELGPTTPVDLAPGQTIPVNLPATSQPFATWGAHPEVGASSASGESGGEQSGEHQGGAESGEGSTGAESGAGGEESATQFTLTDTFDDVRAGARLILSYDAATNAFTGTVENTTAAPLKQVRVEVHLSNGTELGPTTPVDLAPGQTIPVNLPATSQPFATWGAHPEVGAGSTSGESGGEQAGEQSHGTESNAGGEESATQFTLTDTFDDVRAGARLILSYDATANAFTGTVENTTADPLKQVRVEVHLSNGTELGPTTPVDLAPGQTIAVNLPATSQPFATWGAHPEVGASSASGESGGGEQSGEHSSGGSESGEHRGG